MEINRTTEKLARRIFIVFWASMHSFLVLLAVAFLQVQVALDGWFALLLISASWSALTWWFLFTTPNISLSADGVRVRVLFRGRFYPWDTIKQAGILYRMGKGMRYNQIILLKAGGSPRRYKDKTFLLRNIGKTIPICYSEEAKNYIIDHYGPLDFNLSDGREEKSIVVD